MTHEKSKVLLNDYFDERLSIEVNNEIQVHLSECNECSQYLFSLNNLMKKADQLPRSVKPSADLWLGIFGSLSDIKAESIKQQEMLDSKEASMLSEQILEDQKKKEARLKAEKMLDWERKKDSFLQTIKKPWFKYSVIGLASLIMLFLAFNIFLAKGKSWEVKKLRIDNTSQSENFANLNVNEIVETNSFTRLEIQIPNLGSVFVDPDSKIERKDANKIQLLRGSILAMKDGAKDFLSIEVPGAEIKDYFLGGQLKLSLTDPKVSILEVIDGWTSIKKDNLETLVLSKHFCKITADSGVGLPYHSASSKEFVEAVNDYCFKNPGSEEALISVLTRAEVSNSVTLWNLMKRVTRKQRDMVVYTIFGLLGDQPKDITDDGLKTLDSQMLQKLIEEIELKI
jgi:hypothetical protein